jgi:hypothetical protein
MRAPDRLLAAIGPLSDWLGRHARTVRFRLGVAVLFMGLQLLAGTLSGNRFAAPFNAAPGQPPSFDNPAAERVPRNWNRLVVSRWDAGQYIELGLRGYQHCPPRGSGAPMTTSTCNLAFYPTLGLLGRALSRLTHLPIDYALLAISLLSGTLFLFLMTDAAIMSALGTGGAYLALVVFNTFTTGYTLVTPQTDPLTLALALGAFVALSRGRLAAAAALAGAASGMRITGAAVSAAAATAILVEIWRTRPHQPRRWVSAAALVLLCGWGELVLMAYHAYRFGDPLTYLHAHAASFNHHPTLAGALLPDPALIVRSLDSPMHDGMWLAAALIWFLLGRKEALDRFPPGQRTFWYVLFVGTVGIAAFGQMPIALVGMTRYLLLAVPLFFAIAAMLRTRPLLAVVWIGMTSWHYWNVDLCEYTGGPGNHTLQVCHAGHWVRR